MHIVDNGQETVDADREQCYDIDLMDMQMPVLDGVGACKQILNRQDGGMERTPLSFRHCQRFSILRECV